MTAYDDLDSPAGDARRTPQRSARNCLAGAARPRYADLLLEDYPRDLPKREIEITEAAQRLANALHLHLD